jgi:hypothetical protein
MTDQEVQEKVITDEDDAKEQGWIDASVLLRQIDRENADDNSFGAGEKALEDWEIPDEIQGDEAQAGYVEGFADELEGRVNRYTRYLIAADDKFGRELNAKLV